MASFKERQKEETATGGSSASQVQQQIVDVPKVDVEAIMQSPEVKAIMEEQLKEGQENAEAVNDFLRESLTKLFDGQRKNLGQVDEIFESIVNTAEAKASLKRILQAYSDVDNSAVDKAIIAMDKEMNKVNPLVGKLRDSVEAANGMFSGLFGDTKVVFKSALEGINARVDTIDQAIVEAESVLDLNERILLEEVSEAGYHIVRHDAMANVLDAVLKTLEPSSDSYRLVSNLRDRIRSTAGMLRSSFSRLILLSMNNENSKLVIKSVKATLWVTLKPLIIENIVSGSQQKAYELEKIAYKHLNAMAETSKANIESIFKMEIEGRKALGQALSDTIENMEWAIQRAKDHSANLDVAQKEIEPFVEMFKEKSKMLDAEVLSMLEAKADISEAAKKAMDKAEEINKDFKAFDEFVEGEVSKKR